MRQKGGKLIMYSTAMKRFFFQNAAKQDSSQEGEGKKVTARRNLNAQQ